ncbi:MAG: FAD-dependent oxidoreductase, partial [Pseudomonadales bacterium]|nr:FAD-dependent oxidoreductase [Pseudomonadales bacterium]
MSSNGSHLQSKQEIQNLTVDLVILGGGIAGLWCLDRVRQAGYQAILLEPGTIGGGQTVFSQGIIHGGAKYTLDGVLSGAANAIKAMPGRWRDCLEGHGEVDLRGVEILSPAHYLWSTQSLSAKMTSFFASKVMQGRTLKVAQSERPEVFQDARFKGSLYQLDELVLDIPSVLAKLYNRNKSVIFQSDITLDAAPEFNADGTLVALQFHKYPIKIT